MNVEDKKEIINDFKKAEGSKKLELWDYACSQQLIWEKIIAKMQTISKEQGIDKKLEKLIDEEIKKLDQ